MILRVADHEEYELVGLVTSVPVQTRAASPVALFFSIVLSSQFYQMLLCASVPHVCGNGRNVATDILKKHRRFLQLQHHDRRKKIEGETLPPTAAELARALPEPITAHEFSKRYGKTMKTSYAALRDAGKFKPKQIKSKTLTAPKPRTASEPRRKETPVEKVKVVGDKSFDNFVKGILKAAKVKADRYNYID